jgi:hypothetical protein
VKRRTWEVTVHHGANVADRIDLIEDHPDDHGPT